MIESASGAEFVAIFSSSVSTPSPLLALGLGGLLKRVCKLFGKNGDEALRLLLKALEARKSIWARLAKDLEEFVNPTAHQRRALCIATYMVTCLGGLFVVPGTPVEDYEKFCRKEAYRNCL